MIHPTALLRTDIDEDSPQYTFCAPADAARSTDQVDCGLKMFPSWEKRLEKFATPGIFVTVLSIVAFLQGIACHYFRSTSEIWGRHYNIDANILAHLIYLNDVLVGVFALAVAYWGNRIHRPGWIGVIAIFLSVSGLIISIPEIYSPFTSDDVSDVIEPELCKASMLKQVKKQKEFHLIAFIVIIVYQMNFAMSSISLLSHGVTYIDDNVSRNHSPGYIGCALACFEIGKQVGTYLSWIPVALNETSYHSIFMSPVWLTILTLNFIFGFLLVLFPRVLPNLLIAKLSASMASLDTVDDSEFIVISKDGFFTTLKRLLTNKILLLNILIILILQSVLLNFEIFEDFFNQTRYLFPLKNDSTGFSDPSMIQYTTNLLKQPFIFFTLLLTGVLLAKLKPKVKHLLVCNIVILALCLATFAATKMQKCNNTLHNELPNELALSTCNVKCNCSKNEAFNPVCLEGRTYFSPCRAGCDSYNDNNTNFMLYQNCRCGRQTTIAEEGPCTDTYCRFIFALSQVNNVVSAALLSTVTLSNLLVTLRCVKPQDKATAIGLQGTLFGLIPNIPVRVAYFCIVDIFCKFRNTDTNECKFYKPELGTFLFGVTLGGMGLALVLLITLLFCIGNLELYTKKRKSKYDDNDGYQQRQEMQDMTQSGSLLAINHRSERESAGSSESLRHLADNIGDDSGSITETDF